jgi:phosphotransferase system enzyme I (PtsP)
VDRNNKQVAKLYNCLHPSVLNSIQQIVDVAHRHNKTVSVCGEMAGDPASALALVGMGIDSLSMSVGSLLRVKLAIRSFTHKQTEQLLKQALAIEKTADIRSMYNDALEQAGLGRLVRAGR